MEKNNNILNLKEVSLYLHISKSMIRKLIYENEIPYFKIGNRYYFELETIQIWIKNRHNDIVLDGGF